MQLWNLPVQPREATLYSLVTLIQIVNGLRSDRAACAILFGWKGDNRPGDIPANLDVFCTVTGQAYGSRYDVERSATLLPFFRQLCSRPGLFRSHAPEKAMMDDPAGQEGSGLVLLSNGYPHIWRWCWDCMTSDRQQYGVTLWRLAHQLPGVGVCTRHGRPLSVAHIQSRLRCQDFMLPADILSTSGVVSFIGPDTAIDQQLRLAVLAESILCDASVPFPPRVLFGAIMDGLRERGLVTKGGHVRKREFIEEMGAQFRAIATMPTFRSSFGYATRHRLAQELSEPPRLRPAIEILLLIDWLFGSWALFRERCTWRAVMDGDEAHMSDNVHHANEADISPVADAYGNPMGWRRERDARQQHRQLCIAFLEQFPHACRTDFWHGNQKSCHWLVYRDTEWIDAHLPLAKARRKRQMSLFRQARRNSACA